MEDFIIYPKDLRIIPGCVKGWRLFAERNNIDWKEFCKNGIQASKLLATNDSLAINFVEKLYERR